MRAVVRHPTVAAAVCVCIFALSARVDAAVLTYGLGTEYTGGTPPAGAGPWLTATFEDGAPGTVLLTVTADLAPGEFVHRVMFNLNPSLSARHLIVQPLDGAGDFAPPVVMLGNDGFAAGGGSLFDFKLNFDQSTPAGRFDGADAARFVLSGIPSIAAQDFAFLSIGGEIDGLAVAARVQGTGSGGKGDAWVTVPEPSSAALVAGAVGLALLRRRRRRGTARGD